MSNDFAKKIAGYSLVTAEITYRMPDHRDLLQTYIWQEYDQAPQFPELRRFLRFWQEKLEGPIFRVSVACHQLVKPTELRNVTSLQHLH